MSLKSWMLERVHRINALHGRADLPPRESMLTPDVGPTTQQPPDSRLSESEHLGPYAALIAAVRDELEHFVASHVRLHLAIADHDRFVLTSIGVDCPGGGEARMLLQQFMREFKPEQVKRYLSREVIAGLPNASAIDLSQFAGLIDTQARDEDEEDEYAELIDVLRGAAAAPATRPYQVSLAGRWTEVEAPRPAAAASTPGRGPTSAPTTPLAGLRCEFDVEDGDGRRRVVLQSVIAGRRYMIGKGETSDLRVNGTYTSRRHAELWLEQGAWWIADAGSTNGLRVEWPTGSVERCGGPENGSPGGSAIKLLDGARIVLSAQAQGPSGDYPWLALRSPAAAAPRLTPLSGAAPAPKTAITPILLSRPAQGVLSMTARLASGERVLELHAGMLPVTVGRSRNQQLVVDRVHEAVSGHHLAIVEIDESGAQVVVQGDNGVVVDGVPHGTGSRFRWKPGQAMVLGAGLHDHPACTLMLARR